MVHIVQDLMFTFHKDDESVTRVTVRAGSRALNAEKAR
jgi:hypothetical protein